MTTFDAYIGMKPVSDSPDGHVPGQARIDIQPHHCNPTGNINGGVIISLADNISTGAAGHAYFSGGGHHHPRANLSIALERSVSRGRFRPRHRAARASASN